MHIKEIIDSLKLFDRTYKDNEIEEALARKDEIIPYLIEILEEVLSYPEKYKEDENCFGHIYSLMLLGHFKENRAHKIIVDLFSLPNDLPSQLFGDTVTEDLHVVLLNTCGGTFQEIKRLALNQEAYEYCRGSALKAIAYGVVSGILAREDAILFYKELLENRKRAPHSHFYDALACCILDLYPEELIELIKQSYEDGYINPGYVGFESFEEALNEGKEKCLERLSDELEERSLENLHQHMSWWACFKHESSGNLICSEKGSKKQGKKQKKNKTRIIKASKRKNRKKKRK